MPLGMRPPGPPPAPEPTPPPEPGRDDLHAPVQYVDHFEGRQPGLPRKLAAMQGQFGGAPVSMPLAAVATGPQGSYVRMARYQLISSDPVIQGRYEQMRDQGQSHNMAEMLATRSFPGVNTDATFMRDKWNQMGSMNPQTAAHYQQMAEQAGISTQGQYYAAGIARFPGDPRAWVDGRSAYMRAAEANNMTVDGPSMSVPTPRYYEGPQEVAVDPELARMEAMERMVDMGIDPIRNPGMVAEIAQDVARDRRGYGPTMSIEQAAAMPGVGPGDGPGMVDPRAVDAAFQAALHQGVSRTPFEGHVREMRDIVPRGEDGGHASYMENLGDV